MSGWFIFLVVLTPCAFAEEVHKGNCYDNAVMESFFHSLKGEEVNDCRYFTTEQAIKAIGEYITFYKQHRLHSYLGSCSPNNFEISHVA